MLTRINSIPAAAACLILAIALLGSSSGALAADRPLILQLGGGIQTFNDQVGLEDASCFLFRAGLGMTDRVTVALDGTFSPTRRVNTRALAYIYNVRGVVRVNLLPGATRPYLLAGGGIAAFDFSDAWDSAAGIATIGAGVSQRIGSRTFVALEASANFYRIRVMYFDEFGYPTRVGPCTDRQLTTATLSVGYEF